ncbi:MAG: DUF554 domain-containing protein [Candidatus Bathyarchaeia archaeon]
MQGTYINTIAVIIGSLFGVLLHKKFPEKIKKIVFQGIGLVTLFIGIQMAFKVNNLIILFFSILIGAVIGEIIDFERYLDRLGVFLKDKLKSEDDRFIEGLVTAFLIFCTGSMTILGAIEDGLNGDPSILYAKSMLDGFASISLASVFGIGVLFSAIPLFIFQGGITFLAAYSKGFFTDALISSLSAVGGILLIGLGINLLEIKKIKVVNLLPSLVVVAVLAHLFQW